MKIKLPPLTKAEKIMALHNQWDPDKREDEGYRAYSYEAETIAQHVRSNSKPDSVEKAIREAFTKFDQDGNKSCSLNDDEVKAMARYIVMAVKGR